METVIIQGEEKEPEKIPIKVVPFPQKGISYWELPTYKTQKEQEAKNHD